MTSFSTQTYDPALGAPPTFTAASASDDVECPTQGNTLVLMFKGGAGSDTITIVTAKTTAYGRVYPAPGTGGTYTLGAAATTLLFIPLYPDYNNGSGRITVTHSASSGVTMAVVSG